MNITIYSNGIYLCSIMVQQFYTPCDWLMFFNYNCKRHRSLIDIKFGRIIKKKEWT